ncbi:glycoside hydrolase family 13 protein [Aquabacterium sp.]|uniref:glycoside hydrolase family 13 protein n=1 Tax=Aquabacterium sp. TaxID=1872578 RepID=UPI003784C1AE
MRGRYLGAATGALLACLQAAAAPSVERIEPPNWWVGMRAPELQLMLHGERLADCAPAVQYPGVRVAGTQRSDNSNYLFVDLVLGPDARPGTLDLRLDCSGGITLQSRYELKARAPGSAGRRGFSSADVILNLVPDRFANGDPSNDDQPGYPDPANRADIGAGRHGGDIAGIRRHLGYFADMGYTMLWPTPLVENKQPKYSYHGYAATDLYRIDPRFGTLEDYLQLVREARARGVGMIQDVVLNHIGSGHWWMADMPAKDWLTNGGRFVPTRHARTAISDAYASRDDRDNFTQGWFEPHMPDLNQRNPLVATYLTQNAIWWVETAGLAGLRVDTYGYSDTRFLADWSRRLMAEYPNFNMVGEEWSGNPVVVSYWQRGKQNPDGYVSSLPSLMDFPLHYVLRRALAAEDSWNGGLNELYEALVNDKLYPDPANLVLFEGNHDVPRLYSALGQDLSLYKMAIAYLLTMPRIPQLYYGTELLMTSPPQRDDGATRADFPGGWPGDRVNPISGEGLLPAQREAQAFLRTLMTWRKTQDVIHHGRLMHYAPENGTYAWFRYDDRHTVMVVLNKQRQPVTLDTRRFHERLKPDAKAREVLSGERFDLARSLTVPARGVLVLQVD